MEPTGGNRSRSGEPAELAALADGSLPAERRAALEAEVARSPELAALLAEQERARALVHEANLEVDAPAGLRARIEAERRPRRRRPVVLSVGFGAAAAATAIVLLVTLPGSPAGPTVAEAATLAVRPATDPPPAPQASRPTLLAQSAAGVPFPNWQTKFGWRASGVRIDSLEGRRATTVFYEKKGHRIGYTIVSGSALRAPAHAALVRRAGTALRSFAPDGRIAVTWLRRGHTCVLSGVGVERAVLLKLAAWKGKGTVPF